MYNILAPIHSVMKREFKKIISRPIYILMALVFPLLSFSLFWILFGQGVPRDMPVAVFDSDHSLLSHKLTRMLDATPSMNVKYKVTSMQQGKDLLETGKCYGFIIFPNQMELQTLNGEAPKVINYYNNLYMLAGSLIKKDVRKVIGTASSGIELRGRQKKGESFDLALEQISPITIKSNVLFNPYLNYMYFLSGALNPTLLQLFVVILTIYAVGLEFKDGTAKEWIISANGKYLSAIVGKILPYSFVFILLSLFMNTFHFYYLGAIQIGSFIFLNISTIALIFASQAIGLFLISINANLRFSLSGGAFYTGSALAFIGLTFPQLGMPIVAKIWGSIIPLTHYLHIYINQSLRGHSILSSIPDLSKILLFIIILFPISFFRIKIFINDPKCWGKI